MINLKKLKRKTKNRNSSNTNHTANDELFSIFLNSFKSRDRPAENSKNSIPIFAIYSIEGSKSSEPLLVIKIMLPTIAPRISSPKITGCFSNLDKTRPINPAKRTIVMLIIKSI